MAPGARSKIGAPIFEPEVFRKQMYCIEECTRDIVETFRSSRIISAPPDWFSARVIAHPLSPRYAPADWTIRQRVKSYRRTGFASKQLATMSQ